MKTILRITGILWTPTGTQIHWALFNAAEGMKLMDNSFWIEPRQMTLTEIPEYVAAKEVPNAGQEIETAFGF